MSASASASATTTAAVAATDAAQTFGFRDEMDLATLGRAATALPRGGWMMERDAWAGKSAAVAADGNASYQISMTGTAAATGYGIVWRSGLVPSHELLGTCRVCRTVERVSTNPGRAEKFCAAHAHRHSQKTNLERDEGYFTATQFELAAYEKGQTFAAHLIHEQDGASSWATNAMSGSMGICTCCSLVQRSEQSTQADLNSFFAEHAMLHYRQISYGYDAGERVQ